MKKQFLLISVLILLFSCFPAVSAQEDSWTCINGHEGNTGKFCTECGAPRPAAEETWTCINGHEGNTGKFCSECGAPKNAEPVPAKPETAESLYDQGLEYWEEKDYTNAFTYFLPAAKMGHADAQNKLGLCYYSGSGVLKDYQEAIKWFKMAADQGDASAQNNLGVLYNDGYGVQKDYAEAVKWFRMAAEIVITTAWGYSRTTRKR